ncbi:MAG: hypothetical protein GY909_08480 [Oligoflexia bacterium]|nr:hypothetical protein [Oligoflexia bacterium]
MKFQVFKKLDEFLFKQMDTLRDNSNYKQVLSKLELLPEEAQKAINYGVSLLLIFTPVIVMLVILIGNFSIKRDLSVRQDIKAAINNITNQKRSIQSLGANIIAPFPLENKSDLDRRLSTAIRTFGLSTSKLSGVKLEVENESGGLVQSLAKVRINDVSSAEFGSLLRALVINEKMKVKSFSLNKNPKKNSIFGDIDLIHFGRKASTEKE